MITALGEDVAYAMCGGCPVPKAAVNAFCHMLKGPEGFDRGNLCLLREIERRQPGILKLSEFNPYPHVGGKEALQQRREEILKNEKDSR